ncbi:MAG: hypothetical protein JWO36_6123 [Myxococcales bacterium]|nr:hypothetical protein [Myxococcales bacterium]
MNNQSWIFASVMTGALSAGAVAQAQPGDGTGSGAQPDQGQGSATAPVKRASGYVKAPTNVRIDRNSNSGVSFIAKPGDVLYTAGVEGDWTLVENTEGDAGWIRTELLAMGTPHATSAQPAPEADLAARPVPEKPRPKDPHVDMPELLTTPTGWLLPAAVLYSRTSIDTGGGVSTDGRVGLGDVAEFGVATTDGVRITNSWTSNTQPDRIQPFVTASFRMGVAENRLFASQPGVVLGFRKSFERTVEDVFKVRTAELTLVASKHLGNRAAISVGAAFWDAEITGVHPGNNMPFHEALHDDNNVLKKQVRVFGGLEARPFDKSEILVDIGWAPVFCKDCADYNLADNTGGAIKLRPQLSWGVRYEVADWMRLESGVRVPDIGDFNLLNAQIFGQVTFTSWAIRHAVDDLK